MGYSLRLDLALQSTDSNRILGRNWAAKHSVFERVKKEIFLKTRGKTPKQPLDHFTISVVRHGAKTLDFDNLISSLKPFIDGLKLSGIIADDDWTRIKNINVEQVTGKERKIIISVEQSMNDASALCSDQGRSND